MPHDFKGNLLQVGDIVTITFKVSEVQKTDKDCNVTLDAMRLDPRDLGNSYLPRITCNSKLVHKNTGMKLMNYGLNTN